VIGILDYDRDGWLDMVVVNANAPKVQLFRNQIGDLGGVAAQRQFVALRFVGGNHTAQPSLEWSNRDALACSRASSWVISRSRASSAPARASRGRTVPPCSWESGSVTASIASRCAGRRAAQEIENVAARTLITVYENPQHSASGAAFEMTRYGAAKPVPRPDTRRSTNEQLASALPLDSRPSLATSAPVNLFTTMKTWCAACKRSIPHLRHLREQFGPELLGMYGIPVDDTETNDELSAYQMAHQPGYEILLGLPAEEVTAVRQLVLDKLYMDGTPATIVTDRAGRVLQVRWGLPTVSEVRKLLGRDPPA